MSCVIIVLSFLAIVALFDFTCAEETNQMSVLGKDNLDNFQYKATFKVDNKCRYKLRVKLTHDTQLPIPTDPANECAGVVFAEDGLPFVAARAAYEQFPEYIKAATGFDHVSMDFNPCGHAPVGVWDVPHYDFHFYRAMPEERTQWTCDVIPNTPVCQFPASVDDPIPQSSTSGRAFFSVARSLSGLSQVNMPKNFTAGLSDGIQFMGMHSYDPALVKVPAEEWVQPVTIMGSYDATINFFETMIPLGFLVGAESHRYMEKVSYTEQTIPTLPEKYKVVYKGATGETSIALFGKSSVCLPYGD